MGYGLEIATFITMVIVSLQYSWNNLLKNCLAKLVGKKYVQDKANKIVNYFSTFLQIIILSLFIFALILAYHDLFIPKI